MFRIRSAAVLSLAVASFSAMLPACSTAPKHEDRDAVVARADSTLDWFKKNVKGLDAQVKQSAAYIVFPDVAQWGIIFGGGTWGRGAIFRPNGRQFGWTAINNGSVGLQAGVQGFRMVMVLENEAEVREFMSGKWNGTAAGVAVLAESGGSESAPFQGGVVVYQGANSGLMAGVNIGLSYVRYEPLDEP